MTSGTRLYNVSDWLANNGPIASKKGRTNKNGQALVFLGRKWHAASEISLC